eukprot:TRINITY_DN5072_c1_g1_i1.p1 TRINITY_DN5072_c1_g1~~TRINITY_DN5072_c1_g1_i1.p1  ORF type:complete len:425 (-),score=75.33 TRINITY_DN5072_c1_g1_i1:3-1277(-)
MRRLTMRSVVWLLQPFVLQAMHTPSVSKVGPRGHVGVWNGELLDLRAASLAASETPQLVAGQGSVAFERVTDEVVLNVILSGVGYKEFTSPANTGAFVDTLEAIRAAIAVHAGLHNSSVAVHASKMMERDILVSAKIYPDVYHSSGAILKAVSDMNSTFAVITKALQGVTALAALSTSAPVQVAAAKAGRVLDMSQRAVDAGPQAEDRLTLLFEVKGLEYTKVSHDAETLSAIKALLQQEIAKAAGNGIQPGDVSVVLRGAPGGALVSPTLTPPAGADMKAIQASLSQEAAVAGIPAALSDVQGLAADLEQLAVSKFSPAWVGGMLLNEAEMARTDELRKLGREALLKLLAYLERSTGKLEAAVALFGDTVPDYWSGFGSQSDLSDDQLIAKVRRLEKALWVIQQSVKLYAKKAAARVVASDVA